VHTAAATLALGGTARYCMISPRSRDGRWSLLERVGAGSVAERPTQLDRDLIEAEQIGQLDFLRSALA
jgi:hypothetical protein